MFDLVIDTRDGGDWSLDLCFAGLVHNLGPDQVCDFPVKSKHREWTGDGDWGAERRTLGWTPDNHLVPQFPEDEVRRLARAGEIRRVWLDERYDSYEVFCRLGLRQLGVPVVVVAGHDRFWNWSPEYVSEKYYGSSLVAMLLDNWQPSHEDLPFPHRWVSWSTNFDHYWDLERCRPKEWDVCFFGYNSHPDRARFIDHILTRWPDLRCNFVFERRPDTTEVFLRKRDYFSMIDRSRVCLNLRGAAEGGKTMRFYEIPYVGSYMLSQVMPDPRLQDEFLHNRHCDYFSDEASLDHYLSLALDDIVRRELIATQGRIHARDHHTVQARWRGILEWLGELH